MLNKIISAPGAFIGALWTTVSDATNALLDRTSFTVAMFLVVVVPSAGWTVYDRVFNYIEATVHVSKVEHVCVVEKRDGGTRTREQLPAEACDELRAQAGETARRLRLNANTYVSFDYTSPVDGNVHQGRIEHKSSEEPPEINDEIQVLISTIDADSVRD
jgi:hypothetical protein